MRSAYEYPQIPWQVSRHALFKMPVTRTFVAHHACVVIGDPDATPIPILGFLSQSAESTNWEALRAILAAVLARYPGREFLATPKFPSEYGQHVFQPLGFAGEPINQFLMHRELR